MGRSLIATPTSLPNSTPHPVFSISLIALSVAACIAVVATLCASCHPRSSPNKPSSKPAPSSRHSNVLSLEKEKAETAAAAASASTAVDAAVEDDQQQQVPQSQPGAENVVVLDVEASHGPIPPAAVPDRSPKRRLSMSLSMKLPDGLSRIRTKKEKQGNDTGGGGEDMIWKKTIILGEKCRLPSDDEEEAAGSSGQKHYHPKTPKSLPISRTNSFANQAQAVPPP